MSKKKLILALFIGAIPLLLVMQTALAGAVGSGSNFSFSEDGSRGHLAVENDVLKVVWHSKALPEEHSNRGGGNIYELYDKRTDPGMQNNIVAIYDHGGGETTPNTPGIGGLGATHIWELGRSVSASDNARFSRLIYENHYLDDDGNAVFQVGYKVKSSLLDYHGNESVRPDNYRVDKIWTVYSGGQVKLDIRTEILRTFMAAEPAYDFSFSQDYGWTTAGSIGHKSNWKCEGLDSNGVGNPHNYLWTIENIHRTDDYDYQLLHSEFFSLYGRQGGSSVRVKMDNEGKGFENGGLFDLGYRIWGDVTNNPTVEYSKYSQAAYGHTLRFFGWWGGSPPPERRHKQLPAGTSWSDTIWVELYPASSPEPPAVEGQHAEQVANNTVAIKWDTNIAADTKVTYRKEHESVSATASSAQWTPSHQVVLSGLAPGATYLYEARSADGSGEALGSGTFTAMGVPGVNLRPSQVTPRWASYSDYRNLLLTVDFGVMNVGTESAISTEALLATADSAVSVRIVNSQVGEIAPGQVGNLRIAYQVPAGVVSFRTNIYLKALDVYSREYYFPGPPPSL